MAQSLYPLETVNYSKANAKTHAMSEVPELAAYLEGGRKIYSLDLLSGYSCPFANECLSKAVTVDYTGKRKVVDGPNTLFRCFSASQEAQYTNVYNSRSHNFRQLSEHPKNDWHMSDMLRDSMPENLGICRIHVAGDFFNESYFQGVDVHCGDTSRPAVLRLHEEPKILDCQPGQRSRQSGHDRILRWT